MSTATTELSRSVGLAALAMSRGYLEKLLADFPADKWTAQPWPGANHALWNLAHVALTDDWFLTAAAGSDAICPEGWNDLFGMGSTPVDDASRYPAADAVRQIADRTRTALGEWFRTMDEATLAAPLPDDFKSFAINHAALMSSLAFHEGVHAGQVADIRRALGLTRVMA